MLTNFRVTKARFNAEFIRSVYSGKAGKCMCGCSGKHSYASAYRAEASKDRGYEVDDEEVNDRMVAKVVRILNDESLPFKEGDVTDSYAAKTVGDRDYVAYFRNH